MSTKQIGLIGIGNMGTALLTGILNSGVEKNDEIIIYDVDQELLNEKINEFNVNKAKNNTEVIQKSKYIILAIKPQVIESVLEEIASYVNETHVIITIAAGISIADIQKFIKSGIKLLMVFSI